MPESTGTARRARPDIYIVTCLAEALLTGAQRWSMATPTRVLTIVAMVVLAVALFINLFSFKVLCRDD